MGQFPSKPYKAPNKSHKKFRQSYGYLNALYYLVISCRSELEKRLSEDLKRQGVAMGVVTNVVSQTQIQGVHVYKEDGRRYAENFNGFIVAFNRQTIVSAYRVFATYLSDFLLELSDRNLISISTDRKRRLAEGFVSSRTLSEIYDGISIPIACNDRERAQFSLLVATRNVIEHNDGKVNAEYLRLTNAPLRQGDDAPAGMKEAGEALAIAEWLTDSVNRRGLEKWPGLSRAISYNKGDGDRRLTAPALRCRSGWSPSSAAHRQRSAAGGLPLWVKRGDTR